MSKIILGLLKKLKFLPQKHFVGIYYEYYTRKKLSLDDPKELNEKIQWLKVFYRPKILNQLVDKYAVRVYVEEKIGKEYLNECYGVYDTVKDVNFDSLPSEFVLKGVHGSGFNLIVKDKAKLNKFKARLKMRKWLFHNFYYKAGHEWAYKDVKPRIIVEKYLREIDLGLLHDYKFFCFNGVPKFIHIDVDRFGKHQRLFYDTEWNKLPYKHYLPNSAEVEQPSSLNLMLEISEKLSEGFPLVRVDLYATEGRVIFGELTFYPGNGVLEFTPDKFNKTTGDYLSLPKLKKGQKYIRTF
ncbi:ATP-grasp fold amidoligase family protein [Sinomicrobium sp.]